MLSDDNAVSEVINSNDFLDNIKINSTVIDMSSTKPVTSKKIFDLLKTKNINFLDAPVSGGTTGAEKASLAIMVGGDEIIFNKVVKILNTMGNPTLVGPIGSGQIAKLANQIIVGVTIGAVAEAIHLCKVSGADPNKFIKAVEGGFADSNILRSHGKKMIDKNFNPGGKTSTHLKDMNNILKSAENYNFKLPISKLIKEMYQDLVEKGYSDKDHSSLYLQIEEINKNGK
jgi:2-hydroxy-3-oxopropionate reductase